MYYRKEIDGLRAIAVVPVVLFHAGFSLFKGGFVGVDIFFVISGYLITSIILKEKEAGTFSLINFYERRARRILPALLFVVICCLPFAWFLMVPHQLKDFSQSLVSVATYTSNIFFFMESGYFEGAAETKPLLHTWSLAVEEQFYIFFPIIFLVCWYLAKRRAVFFGCLILCILSLLLSQWASSNAVSANFYLAPMRAWELLIGSMCAVYLTSSKVINFKGVDNILALLGLLMVCTSIVVFSEATPHPSFYTLIPVMGTAMIILFAKEGNAVAKLLSLNVLVGIGLISYSAYLWHVPLLAFLRIYTFDEVGLIHIIFVIPLTFLLAYFSWKYIEGPFRKKDVIGAMYFYVVIVGLSLGLVFVGVVGHVANGFHELKVSQLTNSARASIIDREKEVSRRENQWLALLNDSYGSFDLSLNDSKVLILGDSKSEDMYVALKTNDGLFQEHEIRRVRVLEECYGAVLEFAVKQRKENGLSAECDRSMNQLSESNTLYDADIVVMTNTWWSRRPGYLEKVASLSKWLASRGKRVLIVSTGNFNDLSSLSMVLAKKNMTKDEAKHFIYENRRSDTREISNRLLAMVTAIPNVTFVSKYEIFCDDSEKVCELFDNMNRPYIYDTGHVTVEGAIHFGRRIHERGWF